MYKSRTLLNTVRPMVLWLGASLFATGADASVIQPTIGQFLPVAEAGAPAKAKAKAKPSATARARARAARIRAARARAARSARALA